MRIYYSHFWNLYLAQYTQHGTLYTFTAESRTRALQIALTKLYEQKH